MNQKFYKIYHKLAQVKETREQNDLFRQQLELCCRQEEERENHYLELQRMRHDMSSHLTGLLGLVRSGNMHEAESYILNLLNEGIHQTTDGISHSGNIVIDSLINDKYSMAKREGIDFKAEILLPASLPFQGNYLAAILGNLLQNALEACRKAENCERFISVVASYEKQVLYLTICNSCAESRRKNCFGRYSSTKKNPNKHGIGLLSVEQAASHYNGQVETNALEGVFQVTVILYGDRHEEINHPPMVFTCQHCLSGKTIV